MKGQPLIYDPAAIDTEPMAVIGAISSRLGKVLFEQHHRSCKGDDVVRFLEMLHEKMSNHGPYAIFWDNATIHKCKAVKQYLEDWGGTVIYNVPYRPELNPIERFWAHAKKGYRSLVAGRVFLKDKMNNSHLVTEALKLVPNYIALDAAS
jgi:transposase